ncbi:LacI family DNA-binding transcriptional regulator [Carboxydochorda subterranea]|uniref:LacI family DNA-binding transcriptional regulator n=1 Tax=Carboxydichorda subterranea TaxID=3109565 RepID=A0ABZ1BZH4_9FIRM|nr:LacI family DNA-binding transcriptional regulator [Limnochorda sp. L945t]WRP18143.1 LacI family DNA-binding transcriptional regulator [Limnochorda sp. L945t]
MPTIRDVARAAGVSEATVSRAINQAPGVSARTRERVLAVARDLHFTPAPVARRLRGARTGLAGVVVPDLSASFFVEIIQGIEHTLSLNDYRVLVCDARNDRSREEAHIRWLADGTVDAILLLAPTTTDAFIAEVASQGPPVAVFGRVVSGGPVTSVTVANRQAAEQATEHLISHGRERIAFIAGTPGIPDGEARLEGYRDAMQRHGRESAIAVEVGHFSEEGGRAALRALLERRPPPDAILAANDEMAMGVLVGARELGVRVPEDIALVGFDNIRCARLVTPALTTVHQPKLDIGFRLAQSALDRLKGVAGHEQWVLPADLVVRRSCGC